MIADGLAHKDYHETRLVQRASRWNRKNPGALIRRCGMSSTGWNSGDLDVAFQLFSCGMVWDGNLSSKASRSHLVANGHAVMHEGMTAMTGRGTVAFLLSRAVWIAAFRQWRRWKRNPLVADAERIKRAMR